MRVLKCEEVGISDTEKHIEGIALQLMECLNFEPRTAFAYARARGHCEYCGCDLVFDRLHYACAQIDHLLPRSKNALAVYELKQNFVLSCSLCNGLKREAPILHDGEDAAEMLLKNRTKLVQRARALIGERLKIADRDWERAKAIFLAANSVDRDEPRCLNEH